MSSYLFMVMSNPVEGREEEYNNWYSNQHIQDLVKVPGIVSAQRFRITDPAAASSWRYLAVYQVETSDLEATMKEITARAGTPAMVMSDALDTTTSASFIFSPITERVEAASAKAA